MVPASMRLLLLCALSLLACSSSNPDVSPSDAAIDSAAPLKAVDYCEATAGFFCDYYLRCERIVAATVEECRATFLETCNARYEPRYVDLETAGLLSLSTSGVEACKKHLATVACAQQINDLMGPCAEMWVGTRPAGSACGLDVESFVCAPGNTCTIGLDLCGKCEAASATVRRQVGEPCSSTEPCVVGASCTGGACVAPTIVNEGDACDASHRCPYRSACSGGHCVRAALLGEDCAGRTCASGRCVTEGASSVCRPLLDPGATCTNALDCHSGSCVKGTCKPLPDACIP